MSTAKPIIKLPPRSKSCSTNRTYEETLLQQQKQSYDQSIINTHTNTTYNYNNIIIQSKELYFEDTESEISDYDIQKLLNEYQLTEIKRERGGGYLSFPDSKIAERVYSLFNGYIFTNQSVLKFKISNKDQYDSQAEGPILEVRHLPLHIDHNTLYDIFRPYGPLSICKPISEDGTHKGKAWIQFFFKDDSDVAQNELDNKLYNGNTLSISVLMANNTNYQTHYNQGYSSATPIPTAEPKNEGFVDYMNLYVKNLDPNIDNNELFALFRKFGRIVSARVMSNPANGQSKGYGFVSFSKSEEASMALENMNGVQVRSKALIVNYHEPKKPRQEKSSSTTTSSFHSPPPHADYNTPYFETRHPHEVPMNGLGIEPLDHLSMNNVKDMVMIPPPSIILQQHKPSIDHTPPPTLTSPQFVNHPSLASLASGAIIKTPPPISEMEEEQPREPPRTLRRKGSLESVSSVMTESSSQIQRHKMTNAVKKCGNYGEAVDDIVDMLLTLKRKQRSICLFNPDFLKDKIDAALEALEVCESDEIPLRNHSPSPPISPVSTPLRKVTISPSIPSTNHRPLSPALQHPIPPQIQHPTKPNLYERIDKTIIVTPRKSKAIPIVAPTAASTIKSNEVKAMLASFEGKAIHEKKQLLGDRLFPLVKATGIRHAPKITIRLLDTIELSALANIMFDKDSLKTQVEKAALFIQQ